MKKLPKVIITSATTGALHLPCMSPYLPLTPDQVVADSVGAAEAGAAIVHLHARDPENGCPVTDPAVYGLYLSRIKEQSNVIINLTTGQPAIRRDPVNGQMVPKTSWPEALEERLAAPKEFSPEITSFNMGPMNAATWMLADRYYSEDLRDWEKLFMHATKDMTLMNTWASMEKLARELGQDRGVVFEYECFDIGHLYALKTITERGWVKPPFFIQSVFGFAGGIGPHPRHVMHFRDTADMLFGDDYVWSVLAAGKDQIRLTTMSALMGGNVRVGLEDSLWYGKGKKATCSAEQVGRIRRIMEELDIEIATPDEARAMLGTKGADKVNFCLQTSGRNSMSSADGTMPSHAASAALFERARRVMPSGYTRHMVVAKPHPYYAVSGDGCWISDVDGNRLLDFVNNFASMIHGHNKKEIIDIICGQAPRILSAIMPTEWEVKLAELLVDRIPSVERVRFMNSGTEALMIAVKAGRAYSGRSKVAKAEGAYHGQYDLLEASYQPRPDQWGNLDAPTPVGNSVGTPQSLLNELVLFPTNNIEVTRNLLRRRADEIGTVVIDPCRLQLGLVQARTEFLERLREETERLGMVLIFDEVLCLRMGYHGMQGRAGVTPDLTTMGKIIGGGLPVGGLGGKAKFMSVFEVDEGEPKVKQSGTFTANPMTMATGHTSMTLLTPEAFDDLEKKSERLREGLERIRIDLGLVGRVEGIGSFSALLLTEKPMNNYRELAHAMGSGLLQKIQMMSRLFGEEGVLTLRGGFIASTVMTNDDIDYALLAARRALTRMKEMGAA